MKQTEHTKGIWSVGETDIRNSSITIWANQNEGSRAVAYVSGNDVDTDEEQKANAEMICKAVNCHNELVEALKTMAVYLETGKYGDYTQSQATVYMKREVEAALKNVENK